MTGAQSIYRHNHTRAPWSNNMHCIMSPDNRTIAVVKNPGNCGDPGLPADENAALITASPILYAALVEIALSCRIAAHIKESPSQADWRDFAAAHAEIAEKAIAALAKAKGE